MNGVIAVPWETISRLSRIATPGRRAALFLKQPVYGGENVGQAVNQRAIQIK